MTASTIRRLEGDEMLEALYHLGPYAFSATPPMPEKDEWKDLRRGRRNVTYYAALEGEKPLAGGASTSMTQNVRGKIYPVSGVWGVATDPAARRKGYCRDMLRALLADTRQAGQVFSTLYPFRESFYERLGYVTFPFYRIAKLTPATLAPLLKLDLGGDVERQLSPDALDEYRQFLYELQPHMHGMGIFDAANPDSVKRYPTWVAFARFDGVLEGVMVYKLTGEEITHFKFDAMRFYYRTSRAKYLLLAWIARHVDQADRVEIQLAPSERPETWFSDMGVKVETPSYGPMGRVLDVAQIGGMTTGPGSFTARISDPFCPWNEGVWRFVTQEGKLTVTPAVEAECQLTIQAFTALVYGTHNPADFTWRGWGNPTPALLDTFRSMFPSQMPHLHEQF
jgi:predicted acetyltransferase